MNKILIYRKRVMPLNTGFKNLEVSTIGKTDSLYSMWAHLGVNFPSFEPSIEEPLLECPLSLI